MKKKIFSLFLGLCLIFSGLFSFSGCSLVKEDKNKINSNVVMKIGDTELTKNDVINAFYTYYQNNSSYFSYYDNEVIEQSFYTWLTVKTLVEDMSINVLYDAETNPNGYIYYTTDDAETVWESIEDYFYSQISSYEKALYTQDGYEETDMPIWLQTEEDEEDASSFKEYSSAAGEVVLENRKEKVALKLTDNEVYSKIAALEQRMFKYVSETNEDGEEELGNISDVEKDYVDGRRNQAYTNYMQTLVLNAKANGNSTKEEDVLKAEVLRIYNAYYESQISVIFQNYYTQEYLLNYQGRGDSTTLNDTAVVKEFLKQHKIDKQTYQIEDDYVKVMTDTEKGASLLMYHYAGKNYYFTVQHILLKFTSYIEEQVQGLYGYSASGDLDASISGPYIAARNEIATDHELSMLTAVNEDNLKDSIVAIGDYYYYDETKEEIYEPANNIFNGYVKVAKHHYNETTGELTYKAVAAIGDIEVDDVVTKEQLEEAYEDKEIKHLANVENVKDAYDYSFKLWFKEASAIYTDPTKLADVTGENATDLQKDLEYIYKVAANMKESESTEAELKAKLASLLFIELEWIYSSDSLGNEMSNKLGYVIASHPDDNGSWVHDFADGARALLSSLSEQDIADALSTGFVSELTSTVTTNYGFHILKIEDVYNTNTIVDLENVVADYDTSANSAYIQEVAKLLKKNYVCNGSNQTVYDYFYDSLYTTLVGNSQTSGTYFLSLEYQWLHNLNEQNKVEIVEKIDYETLLASLS